MRSTIPDPHSANLKLLPYQAAFAANKSRFKIGLWARQTGKDFTCAAEAVFDCIRNPKTTWLIVAAGERQAIESLEKAKEWAEHLQLEIKEYSISSSTGLRRNATAEIKWANGSRIIALPARPETIRGYSASVILTEFAFHENPDAIWRAVFPSISNPLRSNGAGPKKLRIISTPNGLSNKFANLWFNDDSIHRTGAEIAANTESSPLRAPSVSAVNSSGPYFKSRLTIHDAIAGGLPLDAAELQAGLSDPEAWAQEYLCEFTDSSKILLPYDLIESCESSLAAESSSPQSLSASILPGNGRAPELIAGLDFARKNHLTVCWILERLPRDANCAYALSPDPNRPSLARHSPLSTDHFFLTREVLCLRDLPTPDQLEILLPRLRRCRAICLDYTGPGIGLGDYLQKELARNGAILPQTDYKYTHNARPRINLELCPFTTAFKSELFPRLRAAFENREIQIPSSRDLREDLHSLYSTATNTGQVIYRAPSTPGGHADRATALALAFRAAQSLTTTTSASVIRGPSINAIPQDPRYLPPKRILAII